MEPAYRTIKNSESSEIAIKKSRFISYAYSVESEKEAKDFIEKIKEKHKDASHNTFAYIVGKEIKTERYSDDGEPSGTAGIPILEKIRHYNLTDTVVVVTRYFGGTLLGTGGLARAYSKGADDVINKCRISSYTNGYTAAISTDYHNLGKIQNYINTAGFSTVDEKYTDRVIINTLIPKTEYIKAKDHIIEMTNAKASVDIICEKYIEMEI